LRRRTEFEVTRMRDRNQIRGLNYVSEYWISGIPIIQTKGGTSRSRTTSPSHTSQSHTVHPESVSLADQTLTNHVPTSPPPDPLNLPEISKLRRMEQRVGHMRG